MVELPKLIYIFSEIPIKIPADFFAEIGKAVLKFIHKVKGCRVAKILFEKKNKIIGFNYPIAEFTTKLQ